MKTKITISGLPGAGKSTIGKRLAEHYKIPFMTVGGFRRKMAMDMGMTIEELNELGEKEPWTDKIADTFQKELGTINGGFVFEGRLSWHFIPNSIKLFFIIKKQEAAERIFKNQRDSEKNFNSPKEIIDYNKNRCESDNKRYKEIYGIEKVYSPINYDIIIDTTGLTEEEVFKKTKKEIEKFKFRKFFNLQ
jgi:predicted cytidylate kinase